ncbi:MAG: hypothetical protein U0X91_03085 [Spirosomataceae bacterium]
MKLILAFTLTICLFACKEREVKADKLPYGLVGTYETASTKPSPVFQVLLSNFDNFKETTTATFSQVGTNAHRMQIQTKGMARKGLSTPVTYGFTADLNCQFINTTEGGYTYGCMGKYSDLTPFHSQLDNVNRDIRSYLTLSGHDLQVFTLIHFEEDLAGISIDTLKK